MQCNMNDRERALRIAAAAPVALPPMSCIGLPVCGLHRTVIGAAPASAAAPRWQAN